MPFCVPGESSDDNDADSPSMSASESNIDSEECPRKMPRKRKLSVSDTDDSSSSSSSSNAFERAPECLDDLADITYNNNNPCSTSLNDEVVEAGTSNETVEPVEYFDFSEILKSQEELKTVAKQMAEYTEKHKEDIPSPKTKSPKMARGLKTDQEAKGIRPSTDIVDIGELLRIGERVKEPTGSMMYEKDAPKSRKDPSTDESLEDDDFIVVSDEETNEGEQAGVLHDVEVSIALPNIPQKRKDRDLRTEIEIARKYNESLRARQVKFHKVTLLGNLAFGFNLNHLANKDILQAHALSIIPSASFYPPRLVTVEYAEKITKWFCKSYPNDKSESQISLDIIINDFNRKKSSSMISMVVMFVALCRQLGLRCRLLMSLQPLPLKPPLSETMKVPKVKESDCDDLFDESPSKKHKPGPSDKLPKKKLIPKMSSKTTMKEEPVPSGSKKRQDPQSNKKQPANKKCVSKKEGNRKVVSTDESDEETNIKTAALKKGVDFWAEVYIESDRTWVPADVVRAQVNNIPAIGQGATKPIRYVVAWNSDNTIKDLTRRYSPHWLTSTPKLRVDPAWWKATLSPWTPRKTKIENLENTQLDEEEARCPIPTTINECKNHPFYALKRHLLKFEAIYPSDALPIGFIRGEAVFSRICVAQLHTKETWLRQGKAVRVNEEPYKIVKARPKWDKKNMKVVKDLPLPLFGYWQVDDYIAPPAVDGKVPKNDFGNVELYRPSMLPAGTVHLQVPGLARVAKKLDIDVAPAVVGWEYHGGSSHPIIDGVIVCEQFQDILLDAWNADIDQTAEKNKTKAHIRAVKNWKKLIRSVIIRRRLEKKYHLDLSNVKN